MASETETLLRVFCAVELPETVRARVGDHASKLRARFADVRASWERAEKLHLTIKFVGEVEPARADALSNASARAADALPSFSLSITGTGAFPTKGPPRVLWLGVTDETNGLATLWRRLEDECHAEGFARDERPFRPHLTIARIRDPASARPLADEHRRIAFETEPFPVHEFVVIRSDLGPGGSHYTPLSRHQLSRG